MQQADPFSLLLMKTILQLKWHYSAPIMDFF